MRTCYLVGAAPEAAAIAPAPGDCVIAADGGLAHLLRWNIRPDLIVGDMDSCPLPLPQGIPRVTFPPEKDDTDMALALGEGIARGYRSFVLTGAGGGRPDHTMANVQLLVRAAKAGYYARLLESTFCTAALTGNTLHLEGRGTVSVFAYGETTHNVTITGMKYPLTHATLQGDTPLGVSNFLNGAGTISVEQGTLLIYWEAGITSHLKKLGD